MTTPSRPPVSGPPPEPLAQGERGRRLSQGLATSLKKLEEFTLHDLEAARLILRGSSIIDWHRLDLSTEQEALNFIKTHELDPSDEVDHAYMAHIQGEAVAYLRRHFQFSIPAPIEEASTVELILIASGKGHRQVLACTILKTIQIINHLTARELLFRLPISDKDVFHLVEEKVYRVMGGMLSSGFPITEFIGGRKNLDSTYTKLLSKTESTAAALYDKLRFRVVTKTKDDILPIVHYLMSHLFPFNYVIPKESTNTLFHFQTFCEQHPALQKLVPGFQGPIDEALVAGDNRFSAENYRVIHFVADIPVRVPEHIMELAPPGSEKLGPVVYVLCEFQMLDTLTDANNEIGDASHDAYKRRQREAVINRLQLGASGPKKT